MHAHTHRTVSALATLLLAPVALAQCPGEWQPPGSPTGLNGYIDAFTSWDPDGAGPTPTKLVAGGGFILAGATILNRVAMWNDSASAWQPFGSGTNAGVNNSVIDVISYNGLLIAAGEFTTAGGSPANRIASWNGTKWSPLGSGMTPVSAVWTLSVYNGELIAGGDFQSAGGTAALGLARWNGSIWQPFDSPLTGGFTGVYDSLVHNNDLVICGWIVNAGPVPVNNIARWDGTNWHAYGSGLNSAGTDLCVHNNELYAGGNFTDAGGVPVKYVARWDAAAGTWNALDTNITGFAIGGLASYQGELFAVGNFTHAGGQPVNNIARWVNNQWHPVGTGTDSIIRSVGVFDGTIGGVTVPNLHIGGFFNNVDGKPANRIATWRCQPPPPACYPDCDESGSFSIDDFICFQTFFALGDAYADCDGSGTLAIDDFICFQTYFAIGC